MDHLELAPTELRVLGCLIEKQHTTPDAYPLTLNSLRLACNQQTNRDPVVDYGEAEVRDALHRLERHGLARFAGGAGSRAPKFRHLLTERLPLADGEQAILCVLMLRGAQTPGELKQRGDRMHHFDGLAEVGDTLAAMIERDLVIRLPRRPGQKEERYAHRLGAEEAPDESGTAAGTRWVSASEAVSHLQYGATAAHPADEPAAPQAAAGVVGAPEGQAGERAATGGSPQDAAPAAGAESAALRRGENHPQQAPAPAPGGGMNGAGAVIGELERLRARVSRLERDLAILQQRLGLGRTP